MSKVRNAVVVIVLCIIAAYVSKKEKATLVMQPPVEQLHDAVAGGPAKISKTGKKRRNLNLAPAAEDNLKDALASNPALPPAPLGNTEQGTPPPPRGSGNGGIGPLGDPNPGSELPPPPPVSENGPSNNNRD
jgi:hypothetical protein